MGAKKRPAAAVMKAAKKSVKTSEITRRGRPRKIGSQVVDRKVLDSNSFELVESGNLLPPSSMTRTTLALEPSNSSSSTMEVKRKWHSARCK